MNINQLAVSVSELEGKKKQVNIGQIKEVLSCVQKIMKGRFNKDFYAWVCAENRP